MSTKYQMWLTYNAEKEKIQLPVLPESFEVNNGSNNESMNITGLGDQVSGAAGQQDYKAPHACSENQHMESQQEAGTSYCNGLRRRCLCHNRGVYLLRGGRRPRNVSVQHKAERIPGDYRPTG